MRRRRCSSRRSPRRRGVQRAADGALLLDLLGSTSTEHGGDGTARRIGLDTLRLRGRPPGIGLVGKDFATGSITFGRAA